MHCPLCNAAVTENDVQCGSCGEMLSEWRVLSRNSSILRQRGLALAHHGDHFGACLTFLEAAMSDPADELSLVDAGRSLAWLDRPEDAVRILGHAHSRSKSSGAKPLAEAIKKQCSDADDEQDGSPDSGQSGAKRTKSSKQPKKLKKLKAKKLRGTERRMLGIEPLVPKGLLGRKSLDPLWETVLQTEQAWDGDWHQLSDWIGVARAASAPHSAYPYMQGLSEWCAGSATGAFEHFRTCVEREPPVLNPVCWAVYTAAAGDEDVQDTIDLACSHHGGRNVAAALKNLVTRLERDETPLHTELIRALKSALAEG